MKKLSNKGVITIDFLFSMVMVMGFAAILFALTFTLTTVEIAQYITFSVARAYNAGHVEPSRQIDIAIKKHKQLLSNDVIKPLFSNGWVSIGANTPDGLGDHTKPFPLLNTQPYNSGFINRFVGASVNFIAPILDFNIPYLGSTSKKATGSGEDFMAVIGSYLGREVTQMECVHNFKSQRWKKIMNLPGTTYNQVTNKNGYINMSDNGC